MLQVKVQKSKNQLNVLIIPIITFILVLSSCGGKKELSLEDLKKQQAELKTQLSDISNQIAKLEGDSNKKFVLVEAKGIIPSIFKTYINVQGHVDAEENIAISSEIAGTITRINVKPGDNVSKGQVLAETDSRASQQQLAAAQSSMALVTQMFEKQKNLWDQKIGTEMQYLSAKTMKESMESIILGMQEQLRMSKIISPIDGTIDAIDIKLGQAVAPGAPAIRVVNFKNLKVKADLAESYASKVHKGDEVQIKFPDSNDTLSAVVNYASRSISAMNRTFGVEVLLDNSKEFHPNQIAFININDYKSPKPVISVPLSYVQKDLKGQHYVLVADGNKAAKKNIVLGREYNGNAEIIEGLTETDLLITSGYDGLNEGDAIKIIK